MSENQELIQNVQEEMWATVELMGHGQTAGRVTKPSEWGGLLRVDVPLNDNGDYRTEFYGMAAIYAVKFVSEEIARAFVRPIPKLGEYSAPIVTREEHEKSVRQLNNENYQLRDKILELERRLTAVQALPESIDDEPEF